MGLPPGGSSLYSNPLQRGRASQELVLLALPGFAHQGPLRTGN